MSFASDSSTEQQGLTSMALQQAIFTQSAWLAHGIMAFLAFGVFVPLAITTAIFCDCGAVPPFCKALASNISEWWLYINVGLNTFTYIFTLIVFSVAVSTITVSIFPIGNILIQRWARRYLYLLRSKYLVDTFDL